MYEMNFRIQEDSTSQGLPYDLESIMHFKHNKLSVSEGISTILPQNVYLPSSILGISESGTNLDFLHVNILYCGGKYLTIFTQLIFRVVYCVNVAIT